MSLTPWQATVNPCLLQKLPDTHSQVWLSLLWGHCSFLLGLGEYTVLFVPAKSLCFLSPVEVLYQVLLTFKVRFPGDSHSLCWIPRLGSLLWDLGLLQQCENFFGMIVLLFVFRHPGGPIFIGANGDVVQEDLATSHASHDCCCQSPCPHGRPLLTHASAGDSEILTGRSSSVSCWRHCCFPWFRCGQGFVCDLQASLVGMRYLILNVIVSLLSSCCGLFFALGHSISFFGGFQHSPLEDCAGAN